MPIVSDASLVICPLFKWASSNPRRCGEAPSFEPEPSYSVPAVLDAWHRVHFDATLPHVLSVSEFEATGLTECDHY
jgi:hypothetical protein